MHAKRPIAFVHFIIVVNILILVIIIISMQDFSELVRPRMFILKALGRKADRLARKLAVFENSNSFDRRGRKR